MKTVTLCARASAWTRALSSSSRTKNSEAPLWVCTAGRGLSVGRLSSGTSAGRCERQYSSILGASRPARKAFCRLRKSR